MKKMTILVIALILAVLVVPFSAFAEAPPIETVTYETTTYYRNGVQQNCIVQNTVKLVDGKPSEQKEFLIPVDQEGQNAVNQLAAQEKQGIMMMEEAYFDKFDYYKFFVNVNTTIENKYGYPPNTQAATAFIKVDSVNYGYSILPYTDYPGGVTNARLEVKCTGYETPPPSGKVLKQESGPIAIPAPSNTPRTYRPSGWKPVADVAYVTGVAAKVTATVTNRTTGQKDYVEVVHSIRGAGW